jgi:hypothetical protein
VRTAARPRNGRRFNADPARHAGIEWEEDPHYALSPIHPGTNCADRLLGRVIWELKAVHVILSPSRFPVPNQPIVGAEQVHKALAGWRQMLQGAGMRQVDAASSVSPG